VFWTLDPWPTGDPDLRATRRHRPKRRWRWLIALMPRVDVVDIRKWTH
jgi:hypothetical protein